MDVDTGVNVQKKSVVEERGLARRLYFFPAGLTSTRLGCDPGHNLTFSSESVLLQDTGPRALALPLAVLGTEKVSPVHRRNKPERQKKGRPGATQTSQVARSS